jgi:hypothetical protein
MTGRSRHSRRGGRLSAAVCALALASVSAAPASERFTGVIADSECGSSHEHMRMGPTDADCTRACIDAHGASYVLYDGQKTFALSDQRAPQPFAGRRVSVVGTLDESRTLIRVESISAQ